ncbi:uroporphyrinogen-III synthase [uncultured Parasutterella sp.]|uniref:uroporphyrinogen-III synthase n=1 Tax=uncultured Parasutterella sp. TaxID=1263098 RepID=UPI0025CD0895|nr:uroporphyrinogen-III synthase [uncultured Parasutterella sp.]
MRTILNMKPGPGGRRLQKELEAKTAGSVYWPAFTFDRSEDYEESVKEILEGAERGALLILVSPTTVSFMRDIFPRLPQSSRFACVGEPTAKALAAVFPAAGEILFPHGSSLESGSELLFDLLLEEGLPSEVVLIRGDTGRQFLIDALREKGVPVTVAPIYKRIPLKAQKDQKQWIGCGEAPVVYLTSTDAIRILEANVGEENLAWLKPASVLTIHPRIQEHLFAAGFKNVELVESHCSGLADKLISLAEKATND